MRAIVLGLLLLALAAPPAAAAELELHILDCGTMLGVETESFLPGVADRPEYFDMTNRCFVVVHPKGTLLWDAGFPMGYDTTATYWRRLIWVRPSRASTIARTFLARPTTARRGVLRSVFFQMLARNCSVTRCG